MFFLRDLFKECKKGCFKGACKWKKKKHNISLLTSREFNGKICENQQQKRINGMTIDEMHVFEL